MIDGRPIVFLYSAAFAKNHDQAVIDYAKEQFAREFAGRTPYIAAEVSWNVSADNKVAWGGALGLKQPGVASLGPGYDHSAVRDRTPLVADRRGGKFYEEQWLEFLKHPSNIVVIETWNEFHEGTDIAESREHGRQYIELTRKYANLFKRDQQLKVSQSSVDGSRGAPAKATENQKKTAFNPLPLDNEWTRWIVGEWVATGQSDAGSGRGTVRIELALNGQFLIFKGDAEVTNISAEQRHYLKTQLHATDEEIERFMAMPYRGLEVYTIDQETGEVIGYLFDSLRCMATGKGRWKGNTQTMIWQWATGHKSTRITTKLSDDRLVMVERIAMPDGSTMEESGEMVRKR
jgi:hypothetical protein